MAFTLLHVSDIHRSPDDPITNAELAAAMLHDRDRFVKEQPSIPVPDVLVVSGDVVQGVKLGTAHWKDVLRDQYREAEQFIRMLAHHMFDDDLSRVVIVPGNHDVDWNTSRESMRDATIDFINKDLRTALTRRDTKFRWDWNSRTPYEISVASIYESRMDAYSRAW